MPSDIPRKTFRQRLRSFEPLLGTFVKSPSPHAIEILGDVGFDFVVLDEEHAPLDRGTLDIQILGARAANIAPLVRVASADHILPALDAGAVGVLIPHVSSVDYARKVVSACRYRNGSRGFSASTRAGRYGGTTRDLHISQSDENIAVVAQIEDPSALEHLDDIAAVEGIDALFIGRGDLTVALNLESSESPEMMKIVQDIVAAAKLAGKATVGFATGSDEAKMLAQHGVLSFVISSDQGFLRREAERAAKDFAIYRDTN